LPSVFLAIAKELKFEPLDAQAKLDALRSFVFDQANRQIDQICLRYTRRRVDAEIKKIGLSSTDISALDSELKAAVSKVDTQAIFADIKSKISASIADQDYEKILLHYDNKGLLSEVAKQFSYQQKALEQFIGRILRSDERSELHLALTAHLPTVVPRP
jgi:Cu/Ag efflux protein CusF